MKKLKILLICTLLSITTYGQDLYKRNIVKIISAPGAYNDGFNIGAQYEHTNKSIYVGGELFTSPWLNHSKQGEFPYYHLAGRFGLNQYIDWGVNEIARVYSGVRAGGIIRRDVGETIRFYQFLGLEAGFEIILFEDILLGASITSDMKNDSKMYSRDSHHTVNSVFVSVGARF